MHCPQMLYICSASAVNPRKSNYSIGHPSHDRQTVQFNHTNAIGIHGNNILSLNTSIPSTKGCSTLFEFHIFQFIPLKINPFPQFIFIPDLDFGHMIHKQSLLLQFMSTLILFCGFELIYVCHVEYESDCCCGLAMDCGICVWNIYSEQVIVSHTSIHLFIQSQFYTSCDYLIETTKQSKSFHQNITFASEQCGCCINPPIKSYIFTPLICTNKSLFAIESY